MMGNADPNEAYDLGHNNLQFELRGEAGKKMAQQNAVVTANQKTCKNRAPFALILAVKTSDDAETDPNTVAV